ncbi:MAG: hypothetical protein HY556_00725 [Euryarchaeota archaeon]|nr:hypothetical protein [Euryarchaeota archaeon]
MTDRVLFAVAAMAIVLSGTVSAGTEKAPELVDAAMDTARPDESQSTDIIAGWIEKEEEASFTTVIKVQTLDLNLAAVTGFSFAFKYRGLDYATSAFLIPGSPPDFSYGHWDEDAGFTYDSNATTGTVTAGSPGYVRVVFKKDHFTSEPHGNAAAVAYKDPPTIEKIAVTTIDGKAFTPLILLFLVNVDPFSVAPALSSPPPALYNSDSATATKNYVMTLGVPDAPVVEPLLAIEPLNASGHTEPLSDDATAPPVANTPGPEAWMLAAALSAAIVIRRRR